MGAAGEHRPSRSGRDRNHCGRGEQRRDPRASASRVRKDSRLVCSRRSIRAQIPLRHLLGLGGKRRSDPILNIKAVHDVTPSSAAMLSRPRDAIDFTAPTEIPKVDAISGSVSCAQ